ncbi:hypothetical protein KR200_007186 [Drosophila serrata]|nr:hypothetical protein KR200_007186 [Drosophila serrata]
MDSFKAVWLLGFLLIFQSSLVRCQSYNPKHIFTCFEILSKGIADVSIEVLPKFKELVKCTRFVPDGSLEDLDTPRFRELASAFLLKLVRGPSCLEKYADGMMELIKPHKAQFDTNKCAYLGVAPQCWPTTK